MPITVAHLELLSKHFHFDINEARSLIGLPIKNEKKPDINKRPDHSKTNDWIHGWVGLKSNDKNNSSKKNDTISGIVGGNPKQHQKVKSSEKSPPHTTTRGPSGYNLYVKNSGLPFKQAVSSWKALSGSEKLKWNNKAKSI